MMLIALPVTASATPDSSATPPEIPTTGDVWDGTIEQPTKIVQKDGVNYYEITKSSQLAYVAQTGGNWLNANYILGNNLIINNLTIKCNDTGEITTSLDGIHEWIPIGNSSNYFSGCFLGNGYLISGIYVKSGSYIGLFSSLDDEGTIEGITLVNSYIAGTSTVGGIVGFNNGGLISNCKNYSYVVSTSGTTGGICGRSRQTDYFSHAILNCSNYGFVFSNGNRAGGIVGDSSRDDVLECANFGYVCANADFVGGVVGYANLYPEILRCVNCGMVSGGNCIGGICGQAEGETYLIQCIDDCYNSGHVTGIDYVGGIQGNSLSCKITNCYNIANISGNTNVGAIVGYTDSLFGKSEEHYCYYLNGCAVLGRGNTEDAKDSVEKKDETQLKEESNYLNWNFNTTWSISTILNNGYPYLMWQDMSSIPLTGLSLGQTTLSLGVGDVAYLSVSPQPATATLPSLTWESSNDSVATVNDNSRVTAVSAGTATVTVSGGGFSVECTVTVTARASNEYCIGTLTIRDADGKALTAIPSGAFLVTVPITKQGTGGNCLILLAAYTAGGQYKGMMYFSAEDAPVGVTMQITLPVDNTKGDIAELKAFPIASFSNLVPIGAASCFPAQ